MGEQFVTVEFFQWAMREMEERLLRSVQNAAIEVKPRKKAKKDKTPKPAGE